MPKDFDRRYEAAVRATHELEKLCERYDVSYIDYSCVFDAIMSLADLGGGLDAESGEDKASAI